MPDPGQRDSDLNHLHPTLRTKAQAVLNACAAEQLPFQVFEGFRSAQRQQSLYEKGRTSPGAIVTNARPWTSYHQYGLAADFVLCESGRWSWETSGERRGWWQRLHEIGRAQGLEPLSWEAPHLQLAGVSVGDLQAGRYPSDGDLAWAECLATVISSWTGTPPSPPVPDLIPQRPPLEPEFAARVGTGELLPPPSADWHGKFGGQDWRYDANGIYTREYEGGTQPLRTAGSPVTCRAIWQLFADPILAASKRYGVHPAIIMMVTATETAFAKSSGFTGPLTFRWEPGVEVRDVNPPRWGDYSAGPMQPLATTARWMVRAQGLDYEPFVVAPALEYRLDQSDALPLYDPAINIDIGTATISQRLPTTGNDPILIAAAYNAGGVYKSAKNSWCLRTMGDHLDRAAAWYGDACAVLREAPG